MEVVPLLSGRVHLYKTTSTMHYITYKSNLKLYKFFIHKICIIIFIIIIIIIIGCTILCGPWSPQNKHQFF